MIVEGLLIDEQNDFCTPQGKLFVSGAVEDTARLVAMMRRLGGRVSDYHLTQDCHHVIDIAHPIFWKDASGKHPQPFTIITLADLDTGLWTTTNPGLFTHAYDYVATLAKKNRYALCIWPEHCIIGTPGNNVVPEVLQAVHEWERDNFLIADIVTKGSNYLTEHYSAVEAEVPDPQDPSTQINKPLIETLMKADIVFVAGQALSHCVANTVRDIADAFGDDTYIRKIVLLTDATSSVTGFEQLGADFIRDMTKRGMQTSTTTDFLR